MKSSSADRPPPVAEPQSAARPGNLTLDITDEEKAALAAQAQADLAATQGMIDKLDRQHLSEKAIQELKTVESLMAAARSAGEKGDVAAMANLARKAHLLAAELSVD